MSDATLAVQKALRARMVGNAELMRCIRTAAWCGRGPMPDPQQHVLDRHARPVPDPSIVIGEAQAVDAESDLARSLVSVFSTLHIWRVEPSLEGAKEIAGLMRRAILTGGRLDLGEDFHCADLRIASVRYLRDPDGQTSHGVMTVEALVQQLWSYA